MILITLKSKPLLDEAANFSLDRHYLLLQKHTNNIGSHPDFLLEVFQDSNPPKRVGFIHFGPHKSAKEVWHVKSVWAENGFGPVLYEVAMELAPLADAEGLAPDPSSITEAARNIWRKYNSRSDISKKPLPEDFKVLPDKGNPRTQELTPELFQYYWKDRPTFVHEFLSKNKLRDRGSALKNFFGIPDMRSLNENANALTVYHGGRWDGRTRIKVTSRGALGVGAYFSPNPQVAADYARDSGLDYLVQCELNLANPLAIEGISDPDDPGSNSAIQALIQLGEDKTKAIRLINAAEAKMGYPGEQVRSRAIAAGYDSLIRKHNGRIYEIVIWDPKLVTSPRKVGFDDRI